MSNYIIIKELEEGVEVKINGDIEDLSYLLFEISEQNEAFKKLLTITVKAMQKIDKEAQLKQTK